MKISLKTSPRGKALDVEIEKGMSLAEIAAEYSDLVEYTPILGKKGSRIVELNETVNEPADIELLDIRTQIANLAFQNTVIFTYLKACNDILGEGTDIEVEHSLSKGIFTKPSRDISDNELKAIDERMSELIASDIPLIRHDLPVEEARKELINMGREGNLSLIREHTSSVKFYTLDGYTDFFYGMMAPSTGYINHYQLKKYRKGIIVRFPYPDNPDVMPEYVEEYKMYDIFREAEGFNKLMGVSYLSDLNRIILSGGAGELIALSEALQEKKVANIADMVKNSGKRIILIAGPSSSGKTSFARRLCIQLKVIGLKPLYLGTDDYFVERKDAPLDSYGEPDFENLGAVDVKLFNDNMNKLLQGEEVDIPRFDFLNGTKVFGERKTIIDESQPIVIEGIHALNDELTPEVPQGEKFKIYISPFTHIGIDRHNRIPTTDARLLRRMARDARTRGYSPRETINSWPKVRAGEDKNIFPYSNSADVLFNSAHVYELGVLKKYVYPLLEEIKEDEPEYAEAMRLRRFLRFVKTIDEDDVIVNNSIIREFIGGSVFVD